MEGLNISSKSQGVGFEGKPSLPPQKRESTPQEEARQEAGSFVLMLRSILGPYKLNMKSTQEDISRLKEGELDKLTSEIRDLTIDRDISYLSEKNELILSEIKKIAGDTLGTFVEKIAFGDTNDETIEDVIEETANKLFVDIANEASLVSKKGLSPNEKTKALEEFTEKEIKMMTSDTRWDSVNLRKLFNKIIDSAKTTWNGSLIKSLILKIGAKILKGREDDFMGHGV